MENKICVYAICKNELQFVNKWLTSMSEADYIVVLDTGSTDGTYEALKADPRVTICEQKIYNPWRFDTPRNDAMELAPKDTTVFISTDLDEVLSPGWADAIRKKWNPDIHTRGDYLYAWSHNEDGSNGRVFWYNKIHDWNWKWIFPVHESLVTRDTENCNYLRENSCVFYENEVFLHHYPVSKDSRSDYLPLLELRAKEYPDDLYGLVYLAHEYSYRKKYEDSIKTFDYILTHLSIDDTVMMASCYLFLGENYEKLGNIKKAKLSYLQGIKIDNSYRECYLGYVNLLLKENKYKECIKILKECEKNTYRHYSWVERNNSWTYELYDLFSLAYYYGGDKWKSLAYAVKAEKENPLNERLKNNVDIILKNLDF